MAGTPWVNVQAATARVAGVHRQLRGPAKGHDVGVDAFYTLLVELIVVAKADDVLQQTRLVNLWPAVVDLYAAPVGLAGDKAVAF